MNNSNEPDVTAGASKPPLVLLWMDHGKTFATVTVTDDAGVTSERTVPVTFVRPHPRRLRLFINVVISVIAVIALAYGGIWVLGGLREPQAYPLFLSALTALVMLVVLLWTVNQFRKLWRHVKMALEDNVARLEKVRDQLNQDIGNIKGAQTALKTQVDNLQAVVDDLRLNQPTPEVLARLDTVSADLETIDAQLDEIAPDPVGIPTPPVEPPSL